MPVSIGNNSLEFAEKGGTVAQVGDAKEPSFYPQVKLMQWGNETNFSLRFSSGIDGASVENSSGRILWTGKDGTKVHLYETETVEGFEFEFELPKKPLSNSFPMTIRSKGLSFIYNPEISDAQAQRLVDSASALFNAGKIDSAVSLAQAKRIIRPEEILDSWAAYHQSKRGNAYKTGKAFHVYRPRAVDADGKSVWGSLALDLSGETALLTIPQEFLDSALYPVKIDPTFGYTSIGGSWQEYTSDQCFGGKYMANATTQIDSLTFYARKTYPAGTTPQAKGAMWGGGTPPAAVLTNGVAGTVSVTSSTGAWYTTTYSTKPSVSNGTAYRLGSICNLNYSSMGIAYDGTMEIANNSYATPAAYSPFTSEPTFQPSIYATYTSRVKDFAPFFEPFN